VGEGGEGGGGRKSERDRERERERVRQRDAHWKWNQIKWSMKWIEANLFCRERRAPHRCHSWPHRSIRVKLPSIAPDIQQECITNKIWIQRNIFYRRVVINKWLDNHQLKLKAMFEEKEILYQWMIIRISSATIDNGIECIHLWRSWPLILLIRW
jgi:hypothetical protein